MLWAMSSASAASVDGDEAARAHETLTAGTAIDRYEIQRKLGEGGMGVVYAAYDPGLDRDVALKLLARRRSGKARERAHKRMAREAMAMARVSHPNVVTINDIGTYGEQSFLAMELVEGQTLRQWAAERPRPWWKVVAAYIQAAEGLAAIHSAGVLHRDVKPDNIMIDAEGRVRVMDLGLARGGDEASPQLVRSVPDPAPALDDSMTREGAVLGTTAYLAPEVLEGEPSSAASDQFAFCVALYETLYGERPFGSGSAEVLHATMINRGVSPEPADAQVPAWLRRVVVRGLRVDPSKRYRDLAALVRALRGTRRRVRFAWGIGATALIGASVATYFAVREPEPACDAAELLAGIWDADVRTAAVVVHGQSASWSRLDDRLTRYAAVWSSEYEAGCRARLGTAAHDARMRCLRGARAELGALTGLLHGDDPVPPGHVLTAAAGLPELGSCGMAAGDPTYPDDPEQVARLEDLADDYARARVLARAGSYGPARELAEVVVAGASEIGYAPLTARARVLAAQMMQHDKDPFEAIRSELEVAYDEALGVGSDRIAIEALNRLVHIAAVNERDFAAADRFARMAEPLLDRVEDPQLRLRHESAIGTAARERADYAAAGEHFQKALHLADNSETDSLMQVKLLENLASVRYHIGDYAQADELLQSALQRVEAEFGPDHPEAAGLHNNLSGVNARNGDLAAAREHIQRAIEIWTATHPEGDRRIAAARINLGTLLLELDDVDAARKELTAAVEALEALPSNRSERSFALQQLARLEQATGKHAAAEQLYQRAIVGLQEEAGEEHPLLAEVRENLGQLYLDTDRVEEAHGYLAQARAALEALRATNPSALARVQYAEGVALVRLDRHDEAIPLLRAAVATLAADEQRELEHARARFQLAVALAAGGEEPARARELAEQALAALQEQDDPPRAEIKEIEAWLAAR